MKDAVNKVQGVCIGYNAGKTGGTDESVLIGYQAGDNLSNGDINHSQIKKVIILEKSIM